MDPTKMNRYRRALTAALLLHVLVGSALQVWRPSENLTPLKTKQALIGNFQVHLAPKKTIRLPAPQIVSSKNPIQKALVAEPQVFSEKETSPSWLSRLHAKIESELQYPSTLRRHRISGKTVVQMEITPDGSLLQFHILQSSGHPELDQLAEEAVKRALKAEIKALQPSLILTLPIEFKLN